MIVQYNYDNAAFFTAYSQLPYSIEGLGTVYKWPAFQRLLPPLARRRVLDLGCGPGHFAREARVYGARSVTAVDLSHRMLEAARAHGDDAGIVYRHAALEAFEPEELAFDLMVPMLALHYSALVRRIAGWLAFSIEHPIYTASGGAGWQLGPDGAPTH